MLETQSGYGLLWGTFDGDKKRENFKRDAKNIHCVGLIRLLNFVIISPLRIVFSGKLFFHHGVRKTNVYKVLILGTVDKQ